MAGTTENYGWDFVDSGADPVSGPQNFQHVPQIDATLKGIAGNIVSMRAGNANMSGGCAPESTHVTLDPPAQGDVFYAIVTTHSGVPGTVEEVSALNEAANGFDIMGCRSNTSNYSVNWLFLGVETALDLLRSVRLNVAGQGFGDDVIEAFVLFAADLIEMADKSCVDPVGHGVDEWVFGTVVQDIIDGCFGWRDCVLAKWFPGGYRSWCTGVWILAVGVGEQRVHRQGGLTADSGLYRDVYRYPTVA